MLTVLGIWQIGNFTGLWLLQPNVFFAFLHDLLFVTRYVKQFELPFGAKSFFATFSLLLLLYNQLSKSISFIKEPGILSLSNGSLLEHHYAIEKTNQQYKNINNRLKNTKKERIIELLLYKISLLKRLTKLTLSGNNMDNRGAIHYYCLGSYWSTIMLKRNKSIIQKYKLK